MQTARISGARVFVLAAALALYAGGCSKKDASSSSDDISETGQQVGDVMASMDEGGGQTNGSYAALEGARRTFARLAPGELREPLWRRALLPSASAAACSAATFSGCSSGQMVRTFTDCTIGLATFSGTVTLDFSDSNCVLDSDGDSVSRAPGFTVTGPRGGQFTVSKTGTSGQTIIRNSLGSYSFSNDGINRKFALDGTTYFDFTTQTTSAITISGQSRANRTLSGGTLRVTNNLNGVSCDVSPTDVTWTSSCNCATSGTWSGSCSDGASTTLTITGCGTATLTVGSATSDVTFDRCYATS